MIDLKAAINHNDNKVVIILLHLLDVVVVAANIYCSSRWDLDYRRESPGPNRDTKILEIKIRLS